MLSLPKRIPLGVAVVAARGAGAPPPPAPTAVERPSATAFNNTMPGADTALNYSLPGDEVGFHFVRKAGQAWPSRPASPDAGRVRPQARPGAGPGS